MSKKNAFNILVKTGHLLFGFLLGITPALGINHSTVNSTQISSIVNSKINVPLPTKTKNVLTANSKQQTKTSNHATKKLEEALPAGVSENWYAKAQKSIRESEYHIKETSSSKSKDGTPNKKRLYQAANRAHNLRTYFNEDGIRVVSRTDKDSSWQWGLTLKGFGSDKNIKPVQQATHSAQGNRIEYQRGNITEWYINNDKGLEQGFTIQQTPEKNTNNVVVEMKITGDLKATLIKDNISFNHPEQGHKLDYNKLVAWDVNNKTLDAKFKLKNKTLQITVNTQDAEYPIVIDPLIASEPDSTQASNNDDAHFGWSIASAGDVNGDGYSDVVIGAPYYRGANSNHDGGVAFVFYGTKDGIPSSPTWAPSGFVGEGAVLSSNQYNARFGYSVASAGDINRDGYSDIIIGAPYYTDGQPNEGAVFIFYGSESGITSSDSTDPDPVTGIRSDVMLQSNQAGAHFGHSVSSANVDCIPYNDIIVGAPLYDDGQSDEGAAFIFYGSSTGIVSSDSTNPDPSSGINANVVLQSNEIGANFGYSVAGVGNVDGDNFHCEDIVIGAPLYDVGVWSNMGAAFVFYGELNFPSSGYPGMPSSDSTDPDPTTGITADEVLWLDEYQEDTEFGFSVAGAGDVDGDGYRDIIVGAPSYDFPNSLGAIDSGAVEIFYGSSAGISADSTFLTNFDQASYDSGAMDNVKFGYSVAGIRDVNIDGYSDIIIGVPYFNPSLDYYDNVIGGRGAVFIFFGGFERTIYHATQADVVLKPIQSSTRYGFSVASAGDINGDGYGDVILGAPYHTEGQSSEGSTFTFYGEASGINPNSNDMYLSNIEKIGANTVLQSNQTDSEFGYSVASAGDINGDGFSDLIVGAPLYDDGQNDEGAAFIFYGKTSAMDSSHESEPDPVIGIKADIMLQSNQANAQFGYSVATAGDINGDGYSDIVTGAPYYEDGQNDEGASFVFYGSDTGINSSDNSNPDPTTGINADVMLQSNQTSAAFGSAVASAGDVNGDGYDEIIIGAYNAETFDAYDSSGAAFIFYGKASDLFSSDSTDPDPTTGIKSDVMLQLNRHSESFGADVASAGDINGDGYGDILIGMPRFSDGFTGEGAALIYYGSIDGINSSDLSNPDSKIGSGADVILQSNQEWAGFGHSVASAGDINGDGFGDLIVGAPLYDDGQATEGAAFIFYGNPSGLDSSHIEDTSLTTGIKADVMLQSNQSGAQFGYSVSSAGDINGDGYRDIVVGAPFYDYSKEEISGTDGAAFVFYGSDSSITSSDSYDPDPITGIKADALNYSRNFGDLGWDVANAGDVDGNGYTDIILGSPSFWGSSDFHEGYTFIFLGNRGQGKLVKPMLLKESYLDEPALSRVSNVIRVELNASPISSKDAVKLQIEVCPAGTPFNNEQCIKEAQESFTSLSTGPREVAHEITGLNEGIYRWRVRVLHNPSNIGTDDPQVSPWFYPNRHPGTPYVRLIVDTNYDGQSDNIAPTIEGIPVANSSPNESYSFVPTVNDRNFNDALSYNIQNLPVWASFNTTTGELSGTPLSSHFGNYNNIIITVTDSGGLSTSLSAFSIDVTDTVAPSIFSETTNIDGSSQLVVLTCIDSGSGCTGPIYYTLDGSTPTTASSVYSGPLTVDVGTEILFTTQDNEGNVSAVQSANTLSISTPTLYSTLDTLTSISGTFDESRAPITSVNIQVTDGTNALVNIGGALFLFPSFPPDHTANLDLINHTWDLTTAVSWAQETTYTITAKAMDVNGNVSTTHSMFTYYNGAPAATQLDLGLTRYSIENGQSVDASVTLTRLNDPNADLSGQPVILHVTDPDGVELPEINLTTNFSGQATVSLGAGGSNNVSFDSPGQYSLQAEFTGNAILEPKFSEPQGLLVGTSAGYAIIVQGKLPNNAGLESHNKTANRVYESFKERGFVDQDIYYYNYDANQVGVDGIPNKANIQSIFENIDGLAEQVRIRPAPIYVVLVDHGGEQSESTETIVYIDNETITPTDMNNWLTSLENNLDIKDPTLALRSDNPRVLIVGACYSGGFVPGVSASGRVIITSAAADEQSYKGPTEDDNIRVGEYFLEELFHELGEGDTLTSAFKQATRKTENYTRNGELSANSDNDYLDDAVQHPLLDDDGDASGTNALFYNSGDGHVAANLVLGFDPSSLTNDEFNPAAIERVTDTLHLDDASINGDLILYANDPYQVNQAYVEIREPTLSLAGNSGTEQLSSNFVRRALNPPVNPGDPYTLTYDGFAQDGQYELFYYVNDRFTGALSQANRSVVYKDRVSNSAPTAFDLQSPINGTTTQTITTFDWSDATDADGLTYTLTIGDDATFSSFKQADLSGGTCTTQNQVYRQEELTSSSTFADASARLCDFSTYYWKVEAIDVFGQVTGSNQVWSFNTDDTNAQIGTIVAMVKSSQTNAQLSLANVVNSFGESASATATVLYNGNYVILTTHVGQAMTVSSSKAGYLNNNIANVQVGNYQTVELLINMNEIPPDADSDGVIDADDNCPGDPNPGQENNDGDALGDVCDPDDDDDGLSDAFEISISSNPMLADSDSDGINDFDEVNYDGNATDYNPDTDLNPNSDDTDNDGLLDNSDASPLVFNHRDGDLVTDGVINVADYIIARRIVNGELVPSNDQLSHGDIYPAGNPDGQITTPDLLHIKNMMMQ